MKVLLVAIVVVGAFLRLYGLGQPSFWVDEVNHVVAAKSLLNGEGLVFPSGEPNPRSPLFSYMVAASFKVFGESEFAARLPSALFGILTIIVIYVVARRWFDPWTAVLAAFLLTFSHLTIGWSRTSRMYTLFQFLYLVGVYIFYKGFEARKEGRTAVKEKGLLLLGAYFSSQGLRLLPIVLSASVLMIAYTVHMLTGLFAASIMVYALALLTWVGLRHGPRVAFMSKYSLTLAASALGILLGLIFFNVDTLIQFALGFRPMWAQYGSVQDSHYFYYYFTDSLRFPWAAFFLIGSIQMLTRANLPAFYVFINFVVPLFLLSFAFAYRVPNYIVHVYPFYVMMIAYAVINLVRIEKPALTQALSWMRGRIKKWLPQILLVTIFFGWVPLSLWFRYALKLPFIGTVGKNGAVAHVAWREGTTYLKENMGTTDVVISTLPLTVYYYLGRVDYNLNMINLDETLRWSDGLKVHDWGYYTGAPAIQTVGDLKEVMKRHDRGFLIVDVYRFERVQYVPAEIARYVTDNLQLTWEDEKRTIRIYRWGKELTS